MLRAAREDQVKNKEHFLAVQAARDRAEFERVLKWVPLLFLTFTSFGFLQLPWWGSRPCVSLAGFFSAKETADNVTRFWRAFTEAFENFPIHIIQSKNSTSARNYLDAYSEDSVSFWRHEVIF